MNVENNAGQVVGSIAENVEIETKDHSRLF